MTFKNVPDEFEELTLHVTKKKTESLTFTKHRLYDHIFVSEMNKKDKPYILQDEYITIELYEPFEIIVGSDIVISDNYFGSDDEEIGDYYEAGYYEAGEEAEKKAKMPAAGEDAKKKVKAEVVKEAVAMAEAADPKNRAESSTTRLALTRFRSSLLPLRETNKSPAAMEKFRWKYVYESVVDDLRSVIGDHDYEIIKRKIEERAGHGPTRAGYVEFTANELENININTLRTTWNGPPLYVEIGNTDEQYVQVPKGACCNPNSCTFDYESACQAEYLGDHVYCNNMPSWTVYKTAPIKTSGLRWTETLYFENFQDLDDMTDEDRNMVFFFALHPWLEEHERFNLRISIWGGERKIQKYTCFRHPKLKQKLENTAGNDKEFTQTEWDEFKIVEELTSSHFIIVSNDNEQRIFSPNGTKLVNPELKTALNQRTSGLAWEDDTEFFTKKPLWEEHVGRPSSGRELKNPNLAETLSMKKNMNFTAKEWADYNVQELRMDHFVSSNGLYFKPTAAVVLIHNSELEKALMRGEQNFTQEQWNAFGIKNLRMHHYLKCLQPLDHVRFFKPVWSFKQGNRIEFTPAEWSTFDFNKDLSMDHYVNITLGLKWKKKADDANPYTTGRKLGNGKLATALQKKNKNGKVEFTKEEWASFGIDELRADHFIQSGNTYFIPDGIKKYYFRPNGKISSRRCKTFEKTLMSGLKWKEGTNPTDSVQIYNSELEKALMRGKLDFTQEEWNAFNIKQLTKQQHIKVGGKYFQPVRSWADVHLPAFGVVADASSTGKPIELCQSGLYVNFVSGTNKVNTNDSIVTINGRTSPRCQHEMNALLLKCSRSLKKNQPIKNKVDRAFLEVIAGGCTDNFEVTTEINRCIAEVGTNNIFEESNDKNDTNINQFLFDVATKPTRDWSGIREEIRNFANRKQSIHTMEIITFLFDTSRQKTSQECRQETIKRKIIKNINLKKNCVVTVTIIDRSDVISKVIPSKLCGQVKQLQIRIGYNSQESANESMML